MVNKNWWPEEECKFVHLATPWRGRGVSRPPSIRRNQISPTVTLVVDPEKIIKDVKGKHRSVEATSQSVKKVHKKYVPKKKVPLSNL